MACRNRPARSYAIPRQSGETLPEYIRRAVLSWDQWSRAERRDMEPIIDEVMRYCTSGEGVPFIASWCERFLSFAS